MTLKKFGRPARPSGVAQRGSRPATLDGAASPPVLVPTVPGPAEPAGSASRDGTGSPLPREGPDLLQAASTSASSMATCISRAERRATVRADDDLTAPAGFMQAFATERGSESSGPCPRGGLPAAAPRRAHDPARMSGAAGLAAGTSATNVTTATRANEAEPTKAAMLPQRSHTAPNAVLAASAASPISML